VFSDAEIKGEVIGEDWLEDWGKSNKCVAERWDSPVLPYKVEAVQNHRRATNRERFKGRQESTIQEENEEW